MTINRIYHPLSDINRLNIPRMEGGQEILSIADRVKKIVEQNLFLYLGQYWRKDYREFLRLRGFCQNMKDLCLQLGNKKEERHKQWREKQLHGQFSREAKEIKSEETREWIRKGYMKKETDD